MKKDKKDLMEHGVNAAKANASTGEEKQYAEELSSELSQSKIKKAMKSFKK